MAKGTRIALGLAGGYVLGRYRKARWLMLLAAGAAATRAAGSRMEQSESSAELTKLADQGREVAAAIVGSRMEGITRRIHDTTESLRQAASGPEAPPEGAEAGETAEEPSGQEQKAGRSEEATAEPRRGQEGAQQAGQRSEPKAGQRSEPKAGQRSEPKAGQKSGAKQPATKESRQRATASPGSRRPESRRRAVESGAGRGRASTRGSQRQG